MTFLNCKNWLQMISFILMKEIKNPCKFLENPMLSQLKGQKLIKWSLGWNQLFKDLWFKVFIFKVQTSRQININNLKLRIHAYFKRTLKLTKNFFWFIFSIFWNKWTSKHPRRQPNLATNGILLHLETCSQHVIIL